MTTIEVPPGLLAKVKLYCLVKKIKQKDFAKLLCKKDKKFSKFIRSTKKLNL